MAKHGHSAAGGRELAFIHGRACEVRRLAGETIPAEVLTPHRHEFFEVFWIAAGEAVYRGGEEMRVVAPGSFVWVSPRQVHSWKFSPQVRGFLVQFTRDWLEAGATSFGRWAPFPLLSSTETSLVIEVPASEHVCIHAVGERMLAESANVGRDRENVLRPCLELLLVACGRHGPATETAVTPAAALTHAFLQLVEARYAEDHHTQTYADRLKVSASTLGQHVQIQTGKTPATIIRERRLAGAQWLLRHSSLSVSEIAYELGFKTPSNFGRFFRQFTGKTPGEARAKGFADSAST